MRPATVLFAALLCATAAATQFDVVLAKGFSQVGLADQIFGYYRIDNVKPEVYVTDTQPTADPNRVRIVLQFIGGEEHRAAEYTQRFTQTIASGQALEDLSGVAPHIRFFSGAVITPAPSPGDSGDKKVIIIAAALGGVAFFVVVGGVILVYCRAKRVARMKEQMTQAEGKYSLMEKEGERTGDMSKAV